MSIGLWAMPIQAQVSDTQVGRLVEALRLAAQKRAPGNNGLVSEWQILPGNIPRWSKLCTGQELTVSEFEQNTAKAREILVCVMRDVMRDEYKASGNNETLAVQRAASWWLTGDPNQYNSGSTAPFAQSVLSFYQQRSNSPSQPSASAPKPKPGSSTRSQQPAPPSSAKPTATSSSSAQVSDAQVRRLVEALRLAAQQRAPGNNGLVSEWQILPGNIPRWSKLCTGQELTIRQFEENSTQARNILVCVVRDVLRDEYKASGNNEPLAVQRTAAWWMTGDANQYNSGSTAAYTQKVLSFYQQQSPKPQAQQPATPPKPVTSQPSSPPAPAPSVTKPTTSASSAQVSNSQVGRLVEALRQAAPETDKPDDELYGVWQVKAENIPRWSQQCIGRELTPTQFASSPVTARAVLVCIMRDIFSQQYQASNKNESLAVQRAAAWWMTGDPNQYNSGSTAAYTQKVLALYRQPEFKFFSHQ